MSLHTCTWCGHIHDPEDGRCDAHAHVGLGPCPCPGDDRRMVDLDAVIAALRDPENQKGGHLISFSHAARFIEREFGGPASSEDKP